MSSHLNTHQEELAKTLNAIESVGGIKGLLLNSKTKIDFQHVRDKKGFDICRMVATMHLDSLDAEAHAFAVNALEKSKDITLEKPGQKGGRMSHALFIKELSENYSDNDKLQAEAKTFAVRKLAIPLTKELNKLKDDLAEPGFPGSHPFEPNQNSEKTQSIFNKILGRIGMSHPEEESTISP